MRFYEELRAVLEWYRALRSLHRILGQVMAVALIVATSGWAGGAADTGGMGLHPGTGRSCAQEIEMKPQPSPIRLERTTRDLALETGRMSIDNGGTRSRPSLAPTAYGLPTLDRTQG
ncbi:MAG: hypothetical protein ABI587_16800 [Gemmatimonadales bacterium]